MFVIDPDKLQRRRKMKGLTQFQLAVFGRCTQQYISLLESGRDRDCSDDIAIRICKALDVELEDYFEARTASPMPSVTTSSHVARNGAA